MGYQSSTLAPVAAVTTDDRVACISTVVHHQVTDPVRATYEVADHLSLVEHATTWALRDLAGTMLAVVEDGFSVRPAGRMV